MTLPIQPTLPIRQIVQGKNPRTYFDPDEMAELETGIRAVGVLEPIVVRPIPGTNQYEIIAGERRWRAAKNIFGDDYDMPVVIKQASDDTAEAMALIENYHRASMSAADEARAAQRQLHRNRGDREEAARAMGWSPDVLDRRLALLTCTPAVLTALTERRIQIGHAELLAGVPPDKQDSVLASIVAHKVTVAVLKTQLGRFARKLADAIFDTTPCAACPHNSTRQAGLFAESLGEGYCQHPTHFEELTVQAVQARADALRDEYPVIRIVKASDGFAPLPVSAEGDLGVGETQYVACQGCQSFGCAVSSIPGSYGQVTTSLCFDAACNSQKVALWRKAQREARESEGTTPDLVSEPGTSHAPKGTRSKPRSRPTNQTPQRVIAHRLAEWRKWTARALMAQPQRNQRVLIALARYGHAGDARVVEYGAAMKRIAGGWNSESGWGLASHLSQADQLGPESLESLVQAVAASAAFGVCERDLLALMNYLEVDETRHFKWDKAFLDLFTMSELESLAAEVGLKKAMGSRFKTARASKKPEFIAALLNVTGFAYQGTVPTAMRYPRQSVGGVNRPESSDTHHEQAAQEALEAEPA
ncbi:PRTRC system ParB family protein [Burkholderia vietnamiensis]|uniref:PRTRC system ParB family protein n=1 Tax=Burkholderia vietnamiensis TaxID=60552 RepID=UPI001D152C61|nr:PRTRC system ParB family protein [Burkholderia vietnamiensis]UEC01658.1 PRTRC system ParB family protein [Burkholderia vietnamiensis]